MIPIIRLLPIVLASGLILTSCTTSSAPAPEDPLLKAQSDTARSAREATSHFEFGLSREEVKARIGSPGNIAGEICGADTQKGPWTCLIWTYTYVIGHPGTQLFMTLNLTFERSKDGSDWVLNSWRWYP